jgi:WD40 repeat protein
MKPRFNQWLIWSVTFAWLVILALPKSHAQTGLSNLLELAWNTAGTQLAGANSDGKVYVWDNNGNLLYQLTGHDGIVSSVTWHPINNNILASAGLEDGKLKIWDTNSGLEITTFEPAIHSGYWSQGIWEPVRWSPDGSKMIVVGMDVFQMWDTLNWIPLTETISGTLNAVEWTRNTNQVITADIYDVALVNPVNLEVISEIGENSFASVNALSWSLDEQHFTSISRSRSELSLWNVSPLYRIFTTTLDAVPSDVEFIDNNYVAVSFVDGQVVILSPQTGLIAHQFVYNTELTALAWNPVYEILSVGGVSTSSLGKEQGLVELIVASSISTSTSTPVPTPNAPPTPAYGTIQPSVVPVTGSM